MHHKRSLLFTLIISFWCLTEISSQIVATPSAGCAPLSVVFSGPQGASNIVWTLGAGQPTSSLANPSNLYPTPGTYNITYNAIVGGSPVSYNYQLVVSNGPTGNFSFVMPPTHCAPMTVTFTGTGGNPGSTYNWAFGDLTPLAIGANQTHTYSFAGNFNPVMTVIDAVTGCTAIATNGSGSVHVSNPPTPLIASSNGYFSCSNSLTTNISGSLSISGSPKAGPLASYNWTFATGSPGNSGVQTPGTVSFGPGQHVISLQVTDNNQCSNTATTLVFVGSPTVNAVIPGTVCLGVPIKTVLLQSNVPVTNWDFGDGTPVLLVTKTGVIDTIHTYTSPGPKTISITASAGICSGTYTQSVFVEEVIANFLPSPPSPTLFCHSPSNISFTNQSTVNNGSSLSFTWNPVPPSAAYDHIGAPSNSITNNIQTVPQFTIWQGSQNPYTIYKAYYPMVTLMVESNSVAKCKASITLNYHVLQSPTAMFNQNKSEGCAPLEVTFRDTSVTHNQFPITGYTLCYGTTPQSCVPMANWGSPITFTYNTAGLYNPVLTVETQNGCTHTSAFGTVHVVNPPSISALFNPTTACVGQSVQVNMTGANVNHWHVTTDNGLYSGCIGSANHSYPFFNPGTHSIGVTGYDKGCASSIMLAQPIVIKGPAGKFRFETTCVGNKKSVTFVTDVSESQTAMLNYGDGNSDIIAGNPSGAVTNTFIHTYSAAGDYTVKLESLNNLTGCSNHTFTQIVKVREPVAEIKFNGQALPPLPTAISCKSLPVSFTGSASVQHEIACRRGYQWTYITQDSVLWGADSDSPVFTPTPPVAGVHTVVLTVRDVNNCLSTVSHEVRISKVKPVFTLSPTPVCLSNGTVQLINTTQSTQVPPDIITNYNISFGDGFPPHTSTVSTFSPIHTFVWANPPSQTFSVIVSATNNIGCTDTTMHLITVNNPLSNFQPSSYNVCMPKNQPVTVNFSASQGFTAYTVSYGDPPGSTLTTTSPNFNNASHTYLFPGSYAASLTVTDISGCKSTEVRTINVIGQPTAAISFVNNQNKFCVPGTPTIVSSTAINSSSITTHIWGRGGVNAVGTPTYVDIFTTKGVETITLTVNINGYCPSTATAQVSVYDPTLSISVTPTVFCLGSTILASITSSSGVFAWKWFFGDAINQPTIIINTPQANVNPLPYPYHIFPSAGQNGKTPVSLLYWSPDYGCERVATTTIQAIDLEADFIQSDSVYAHCIGIPDNFKDLTPNPINLNLDYKWSFTGSGPAPKHTFTAAGVFPVTMTVTDMANSCTSTATKNMTIFPLPTASINVQDRSCPDSLYTIDLSGTPGISGLVTGTLIPSMGPLTLDSLNRAVIMAASSAAQSYSFIVSDNNGCMSNPVRDSIFIEKKANSIVWDTTVIIGEHIPINAFVGADFTYTWMPVTTSLSCTDCTRPVSTTTDNITYSVTMTDLPLRCFEVISTFRITILPKTSVDVPSAFTPNGDGTNDIIYADGWGIRKLNYFRIFNRWGQLLFETNDVNIGWDGTFNGVPQNMETYVYQVSVDTYTNEEIAKTGSFKLLR